MKRNRKEQHLRKVNYFYGCAREILCKCTYFEIEWISFLIGFGFTVLDSLFQILLCLDCQGGIREDGIRRTLRLKKDDCIFIPAGIGRCRMLGQSGYLKYGVNSSGTKIKGEN